MGRDFGRHRRGKLMAGRTLESGTGTEVKKKVIQNNEKELAGTT